MKKENERQSELFIVKDNFIDIQNLSYITQKKDNIILKDLKKMNVRTLDNKTDKLYYIPDLLNYIINEIYISIYTKDKTRKGIK